MELEQRNLFIIPLDNERQWYRYHHLFAELLRTQSGKYHPETIPELHRKAAGWFEYHGLMEEAVRHAILAQDYELTTRLVDQVRDRLWGRGDTLTLLNWFKTIPEELIRSQPYNCLAYASAFTLTGQFESAEQWFQCVDDHIHRANASRELSTSQPAAVNPSPFTPWMLYGVDSLRSMIARFTLETSQGTYGGILSFLLVEGAQGVEPSKVTIYPLNQAGQTASCISELQSSFMPGSTSTPSADPVKTKFPSFPSGLSVEEHLLMEAHQVDPLSFSPVLGCQEDVLKRHQQERGKRFSDNYIVEQGRGTMSVDWQGGKLMARETRNKADNRVGVEVISGSQTIFSIQLGDSGPIRPLQGLWTYGSHWILEVVHVSQQINSENEVKSAWFGEIIWDGPSLNEKKGYDESFGFQLMHGKPFYFFRKEGRIGFVYDVQEVLLEYTQVPHYECCSGAELNPVSAENMVAFFAQRDGKWYYVEIGAFE